MGNHVNATLRARFRALRRAKRIVRRMQVECEPAGGFSLSELCEMAADVPDTSPRDSERLWYCLDKVSGSVPAPVAGGVE